MDMGYFIRKLFALFVSLLMAYIPISIISYVNDSKSDIIYLFFGNPEVIFSLIAITVLSFFDIIEVIQELKLTILTATFVLWIISILVGIASYVVSKTSKGDAYIITNAIVLAVTILSYTVFYIIISMTKSLKSIKNKGV